MLPLLYIFSGYKMATSFFDYQTLDLWINEISNGMNALLVAFAGLVYNSG